MISKDLLIWFQMYIKYAFGSIDFRELFLPVNSHESAILKFLTFSVHKRPFYSTVSMSFDVHMSDNKVLLIYIHSCASESIYSLASLRLSTNLWQNEKMEFGGTGLQRNCSIYLVFCKLAVKFFK